MDGKKELAVTEMPEKGMNAYEKQDQYLYNVFPVEKSKEMDSNSGNDFLYRNRTYNVRENSNKDNFEAKDLEPFRKGDNPDFQAFLKALDSKYGIASTTHLKSQLIPQYYNIK
ncbi:hypothetical protein JTB14_011719 [Gonioctena quinquepunctata]|nr:hypothetical protein JTB14_011719 [Gonioctena quinquepunctata]